MPNSAPRKIWFWRWDWLFVGVVGSILSATKTVTVFCTIVLSLNNVLVKKQPMTVKLRARLIESLDVGGLMTSSVQAHQCSES